MIALEPLQGRPDAANAVLVFFVQEDKRGRSNTVQHGNCRSLLKFASEAEAFEHIDNLRPPTSPTFANDDLLNEHYLNHGDELGAISPSHYETLADDFLTGTPGPTTLEKINKNGDLIRWNQTTDEFGVITTDGSTIRSYYILDPKAPEHNFKTNLDYWNNQ